MNPFSLGVRKIKNYFFKFSKKNDKNIFPLKIFQKVLRTRRATSNPFRVFWSVEQEYAIKVERGLDRFWDIGRSKIFYTGKSW